MEACYRPIQILVLLLLGDVPEKHITDEEWNK